MSAAAATPAAADRTEPLVLFRDDGPIARTLGSVVGGAVRLPPVALIVAGIVPLVAAIVIDGDGASKLTTGAVVAWVVLAAGISSGRPHTDPLGWAVPAALRFAEYGTVLWLAAVAGGSAPAGAFALLAVVAFRQYDLVYRPRYQGVAPPRWVGDLAGGWEGRLLAAWALLALDALPAGLFAIASALAVLFVGESVASWLRFRRASELGLYEDEEDEEE